ncbi:MAG: aldo/keto reductase [Phycisphaerales bacterium]|nr:aldo/keto reductase [Phycisphaerales bacterium]
MTDYTPNPQRYHEESFYRKCGRSGLKLPAISLGCWQNFGGAGTDTGGHFDDAAAYANCRAMLTTAFELARARGQILPQMALLWCLRLPAVTTLIIGASRPQQIIDNAKALAGPPFEDEERKNIEAILNR